MDLGGGALRSAFPRIRGDRACRPASQASSESDRAATEGPWHLSQGEKLKNHRPGLIRLSAHAGKAGFLTIARRFRDGFWFLALLLICAPAQAAVEIAFYSRELGGNNFPHAFVSLRGTLAETGEQVDTSYGFTAKAITPAILWGSVAGEIIVEGPRQIARSDRQFALTLSDAQYHAVMAVVEEWRARAQPSYNLNRRNCVHFVAQVAETVGLRVEYVPRLMKRPRSFLEHVRALNPDLPSQEESETPA